MLALRSAFIEHHLVLHMDQSFVVTTILQGLVSLNIEVLKLPTVLFIYYAELNSAPTDL